MKKIEKKILVWILLFLLIPATYSARNAVLHANGSGTFLPDARWSGVLRIWTSAKSAFGTGSSVSWLNARAAAFEKKYSGVRVQIISVEPEMLAMFATAEYPPDGLLFSPGVLQTTEGLAELSIQADLRSGLAGCGADQGVDYALPVAMGAYFWITATDVLRCRPGSTDCPEGYRLQFPADRADASWSAALLALFSGYADGTQTEIIWPGADLGLSEPDEPAQTAPVPSVPLMRPAAFPEDVGTQASVRALFTAGETDAIIATQQELRRLEILADSGRTPDYAVYAGGTAFSDLLAMAAVVDKGNADSEQLCEAFFAFLLEEESQAALIGSYAFRVTQGVPLYSAHRAGMASAEASLDGGVLAPNAFDPLWRSRAAQAAALFVSGAGEARELLSSVWPDAALP